MAPCGHLLVTTASMEAATERMHSAQAGEGGMREKLWLSSCARGSIEWPTLFSAVYHPPSSGQQLPRRQKRSYLLSASNSPVTNLSGGSPLQKTAGAIMSCFLFAKPPVGTILLLLFAILATLCFGS
eukprot:GGOE01021267.1.p1 GENE.GGOE01021267.1~~GGOE01021267.1.p1  ORF type:complete len:127 (-),score=6.12 GGOE01021267.1:63-443(-)